MVVLHPEASQVNISREQRKAVKPFPAGLNRGVALSAHIPPTKQGLPDSGEGAVQPALDKRDVKAVALCYQPLILKNKKQKQNTQKTGN